MQSKTEKSESTRRAPLIPPRDGIAVFANKGGTITISPAGHGAGDGSYPITIHPSDLPEFIRGLRQEARVIRETRREGKRRK